MSEIAEVGVEGSTRSAHEGSDPAVSYARHDLNYYTKSLRHARWMVNLIDLLTIGSAATTTALATLQAPPLVTAAVGLVTVISTAGKKAWNPEARRLSVAQARTEVEQLLREYETRYEAPDRRLLVTELGKVKTAEFSRFKAQKSQAQSAEESGRQ